MLRYLSLVTESKLHSRSIDLSNSSPCVQVTLRIHRTNGIVEERRWVYRKSCGRCLAGCSIGFFKQRKSEVGVGLLSIPLH